MGKRCAVNVVAKVMNAAALWPYVSAESYLLNRSTALYNYADMKMFSHIIASALIVALTIGASLYAAQTTDMAVKMSVADISDGMMTGCDDCEGDDEAGAKSCPTPCIASFVALVSSISGLAHAKVRSVIAERSPSFLNQFGSPDPYPPKFSVLS